MEAPGFRPGVVDTTVVRPGQAGLVLTTDPEALPPDAATRLDNFDIDGVVGSALVRYGLQTFIQLGSGNVHSLGRLYQPSTGAFVAFLGVNQTIYRGTTPATMVPIYTGSSGNPLTFLPYRPRVSSDAWMIVADSNGIGQIPPTGEIQPLGLPAPVTGCTTRIADILTTAICGFEGSQGAASWVMTAGRDMSETPVTAGVPTAADVTGLQNSCVEFTTQPGAAVEGYSSVVGLALSTPINLTQLQSGFAPATDDDLIHLFLRIDRPALVQEIRIYFVCSSGFAPSIVPGQHESLNTEAFVKAFTPSEYTGFIEGQESSDDAADREHHTQVRRDYVEMPDPRYKNDERLRSGAGLSPDYGRGATRENTGRRGGDARLSEELATGRNAWTQYGGFGTPLRRRDFERIGTAPDRGWNTITGIVIVIQTATNASVKLACDDWFLTGGYGLDTTEPGAVPYDYRYTHYNTLTGDESNPSEIQSDANWLRAARQRIRIQPNAPFAGAAQSFVRQRFYRRGGTLTDDWYYIGQNTGNGSELVDTLADLEIVNAPTLEIDNFQPVPSLDNAGNTVIAQPLAAMWGPIDGALYGCGDTRRPGHLYRSKTERPGSWPPDLVTEVCSPSEELMNGGEYGGQGFVFSRRRLFATATDGDGLVRAQDTGCQKGLAGRWAFAVGREAIYFISNDGVYATTGNAPTELSEALRPLWRGQTIGVHTAIDLSQEAALRLFVHKDRLYFLFQDVLAVKQCYVYSLTKRVWWRRTYPTMPSCLYSDQENAEVPLIYGLSAGGFVMLEGGFTDNGTAVTAVYEGPHLVQGRPREEKQLADCTLLYRALRESAVATANLWVDDATAWTPFTVPASPGANQARVTFDPGAHLATLARARAFQPRVTWVQSLTAVIPGELQQFHLSTSPLPEETFKRLSQWEPLGKNGGYLTGVVVTMDTQQVAQAPRTNSTQTREFRVEYQVPGELAIRSLGPFRADGSTGRRKQFMSWPGVRAAQVRIVPTDDNNWLLYALEWEWQQEPPTQHTWDSNEEIKGDTYYTGLDLIIDTLGREATLEVFVDQASKGYFNVQTQGKQLVHLTLTPGYGHIYRFVLTGAFASRLYGWTWILDPVPGEQANWNRNFEIGGTLTDKYIKGVLLECDTNGANKTVQVQVDGTVGATVTANAAGRKVLHLAFPQVRGRVLRLMPTDSQPGRLWNVQWVFDEEPLGLVRWETQALDHGQGGWHSLLRGFIAYRSVTDLTLTVTGYDERGTVLFADEYVLPHGGGEKRKQYLTFKARRAVLYKYLIVAADQTTIISAVEAGICAAATVLFLETFESGASAALLGAVDYAGLTTNLLSSVEFGGALLGSTNGLLSTADNPQVGWNVAFGDRRYGWVEAYCDFSRLVNLGWTLFAATAGNGNYTSGAHALFDVSVGTEAGVRKFWFSNGHEGANVATLPAAFQANTTQKVKVCWRQSTYTSGLPNADGELYLWIDDVLVWSLPAVIIARGVGDTTPQAITRIYTNPCGRLDQVRIGYGTEGEGEQVVVAPAPCWVYREETQLELTTGQRVAPFGSDNLDKVRQMGNASGIASTPNNGVPDVG